MTNKESVTTLSSSWDRLGYSVTETGHLLGISARSVRRLLKRQLIGGSRALRNIIIPRAEIERFLKDTTEQIAKQ